MTASAGRTAGGSPRVPAPAGGRPVARLLAPILVRMGMLLAVMAAICIGGVLASTQALDHLTDELLPAATANEDVLQDLTDMDAAVGAYARSGEQEAIDNYEQAMQRLPGHERRVREYARGDASLELLVTRQQDAADAWVARYAEPRVDAPGGPGTFQQERYDRGQRLFDAVRETHLATHEEFDRRQRDASSDAQWRFRGTILAVVVLGLLGWFLVGRSRRRLDRELSAPLLAIEATVQRVARAEADVRAEVAGPREVRAVAVALNELLEQQSRARAVEARIQTELRALDTARDDFVSNVSHELRTPLTTISGYLEMVAEEFENDMAPRHERMLEATRRNVSRLKTLIDDLLTLSKAENRGTDLEQVDLDQVVRDAATDVRITAARRGIAVSVTAPGRPLPVLADRAMLNRAFLNVLSNAVKFSKDGDPVEVEVTASMGQVQVAVRDHGIGIPTAELERLGTRFFRASNAVRNEIAGTGLGVRIVQTIIDKHQGRVLFESEEGRGTTVTISLPLQGDRVPAAPAPAELVGADEGTHDA
ncbi:ATP-binding protein [Nocardioides abyssi]|uniref:Sensor-like histidine kinase SenX3 n=1 Tax=Nocardioides abyssi TaxID=3058370 RepID=A0ABT8EY10_9ACTN|nr:ATP-binding protein [Nocardioides abyssi]MDN4162756.1 ATP-binding protein [Nocardioides abyssi]